jgi:hypothetical protein
MDEAVPVLVLARRVRRYRVLVDVLRAAVEMLAQERQVVAAAGELPQLALADVAEVARGPAAVLRPLVVLPGNELRLAQSDASSS